MCIELCMCSIEVYSVSAITKTTTKTDNVLVDGQDLPTPHLLPVNVVFDFICHCPLLLGLNVFDIKLKFFRVFGNSCSIDQIFFIIHLYFFKFWCH